jgi:hypothetical protein
MQVAFVAQNEQGNMCGTCVRMASKNGKSKIKAAEKKEEEKKTHPHTQKKNPSSSSHRQQQQW